MEQALIPINDIVKKGWLFYKANYQKFYKSLAILISSFVVYFLYFQYVFDKINIWLSLILAAIVLIGFLFVNFWIYVCIIKITDNCLRDKQYDENALFNDSLKNIVPILWISVLTGLIVLGGIFLFIIPAIFWGIWYSFAVYVNILEDKNPKSMEALSISKKLVKKRAWDTYGRLLFPTLFVEVTIYLAFLIILLVLYIAGVDLELALSIFSLFSTVIILALMPLFYSFQIILYNNLKETRPTAVSQSPHLTQQ